MRKTIAQQCFDAFREMSAADDLLFSQLEIIFPDQHEAIIETSNDEYDSSLELMVNDIDFNCSKEQLDKIVILGFDLLFVNFIINGKKIKQNYFNLKRMIKCTAP